MSDKKIVKVNYTSLKNGEGKRNSVGCIPGLDLEQLAQTDPVVALALLQSPSKQPEIFSLRAQFTSGALNEQVPASTDEGGSGFCSDFLILSARYQVRMNNNFSGSILKGQQDVNNALNSGIDVTLQVEGSCPTFDMMSEPVPIELVADPPGVADGCCGFPYGYVAPKCGHIKALFTNTRPFIASPVPGGPGGPIEVFMAFRGISLGCGLQTIELPFALDELDRLGIRTKHVIVG